MGKKKVYRHGIFTHVLVRFAMYSLQQICNMWDKLKFQHIMCAFQISTKYRLQFFLAMTLFYVATDIHVHMNSYHIFRYIYHDLETEKKDRKGKAKILFTEISLRPTSGALEDIPYLYYPSLGFLIY